MLFSIYERMADICTAANDDRSTKAMILTGAGDKAFAPGNDISQFRAFKTAQDALDYEARIDRVLMALETSACPPSPPLPGLHRRRRRHCCVLRSSDRHRIYADRLSDRAHARQLPVDVEHLARDGAGRPGAH